LRGPDEAEATEGAEAEGTPAGDGAGREDAGQRGDGGRGRSAVEHERNSRSDRAVALPAAPARRAGPGRQLTSARFAIRRPGGSLQPKSAAQWGGSTTEGCCRYQGASLWPFGRLSEV